MNFLSLINSSRMLMRNDWFYIPYFQFSLLKPDLNYIIILYQSWGLQRNFLWVKSAIKKWAWPPPKNSFQEKRKLPQKNKK